MPDGRGRSAPGDWRDVEAELRRLAQRVDVPAAPDYATRVTRQLERSGRGGPSGARERPWVGRLQPITVAVLALVAGVAVVLSVPAARHAVADIFGIAGVRVQPLPSTRPTPRATLDPRLDLGDPVQLAEARRKVPFPVGVPVMRGSGAPAVYVRHDRGLDSVNLVYPPQPGLPAGADPSVGLLLSEYAGNGTPYFDKLVAEEASVARVTVDGRWPGLYFSEPQHVFVPDSRGIVHFERARMSGPSLVWVQNDVTYRIEAAVDRETLLAVAASVR